MFVQLRNYIEHLLILDSTITGCVSISPFASLVGIPIGITSSEIGLKICAITAMIKKYKSLIMKKKKKHDKIVLLANSKLNSIEVLIFKVLIDSVISRDRFVLINNVLRNERRNNLNQVYSINKTMLLGYCLKCRKNTESKNPKVANAKKGE